MVDIFLAAMAGQTRPRPTQDCGLPQLRRADWLRVFAAVVIVLVFPVILSAQASVPGTALERSGAIAATHTAAKLAFRHG